MGFIPLFIMLGGILFLWALVVYSNLQSKAERIETISSKLRAIEGANAERAGDNFEELKEIYHSAVTDYNLTVQSSQAKVWARVFNFRQKGNS